MGIKTILDTILTEWIGLNPRIAKGIRIVWDVFEIGVVLALLFSGVFYMGQIHYCDELVQANFGWMFNESAQKLIINSTLHVLPNQSEVINHVPFFGTG